MRRSDIYCSRSPVKPRLRDSNAACFESSGSRLVKIVGENVIEYPEYDGNSMYRTLGNIKRNPNAVREVRRQEPTNSHQWKGVHPHGKRISGKTLWRKVRGTNRVRALPELSPVHPEPYGRDLVLTCSPKGPPPPEWKRRDYIREILPRDDPHRKEVWTRGPEES
jgi:hypothetical protein